LRSKRKNSVADSGSDAVAASDFARALAQEHCTVGPIFCETRGPDVITFGSIPSDGSVKIIGGSISYWKVRSKDFPAIVSAGSTILVVPIPGD